MEIDSSFDLGGGDREAMTGSLSSNDETDLLLLPHGTSDEGTGDISANPHLPDLTDNSELPRTFDRFKEKLDEVVDLLERIRTRANKDELICSMIDQLGDRQDEFEEQKRMYMEDLAIMTDKQKAELKAQIGACLIKLEDVFKALSRFEDGIPEDLDLDAENEDEVDEDEVDEGYEGVEEDEGSEEAVGNGGAGDALVIFNHNNN